MNIEDIYERYNSVCREAYLLEKSLEYYEYILSKIRKHLLKTKSEMVYLDRLIQSEGEIE